MDREAFCRTKNRGHGGRLRRRAQRPKTGERRKRSSLNLAWLRGMAGVVYSFWCHAFSCLLHHKVLGGSGTRGERGIPATGKALWPDARASVVDLFAALPLEGVVCTTAVTDRCVAAAPSTPYVMLLLAGRGLSLTALLPYRLFPNAPRVAQRLQWYLFMCWVVFWLRAFSSVPCASDLYRGSPRLSYIDRRVSK